MAVTFPAFHPKALNNVDEPGRSSGLRYISKTFPFLNSGFEV